MKNLKILSISFLVLSLLGFLDALYLAMSHYRGLFLKCFVGNCETVLTGPYAVVAGIPVALPGTIYYLALFILAVLYFDTKNNLFIKNAARLTIVGFLAALYFLFLQFFVIKAVCFYCLISAGLSILLFVLGLVILAAPRPPRSIP